jgi:hypothetical protein
MMMNMTAAMERNLSNLLKEYGKEVVEKLAGKYGFDVEEAWRSLSEVEVKKVKKERKPREKKEGQAKPKGRPKKDKKVDIVGETADLFEELMEAKIAETVFEVLDTESESDSKESDSKESDAKSEKAKAKEAEKAEKAKAKEAEKAE